MVGKLTIEIDSGVAVENNGQRLLIRKTNKSTDYSYDAKPRVQKCIKSFGFEVFAPYRDDEWSSSSRSQISSVGEASMSSALDENKKPSVALTNRRSECANLFNASIFNKFRLEEKEHETYIRV